jgi:hypothetical protein
MPTDVTGKMPWIEQPGVASETGESAYARVLSLFYGGLPNSSAFNCHER